MLIHIFTEDSYHPAVNVETQKERSRMGILGSSLTLVVLNYFRLNTPLRKPVVQFRAYLRAYYETPHLD